MNGLFFSSLQNSSLDGCLNVHHTFFTQVHHKKVQIKDDITQITTKKEIEKTSMSSARTVLWIFCILRRRRKWSSFSEIDPCHVKLFAHFTLIAHAPLGQRRKTSSDALSFRRSSRGRSRCFDFRTRKMKFVPKSKLHSRIAHELLAYLARSFPFSSWMQFCAEIAR